MTTRAEVDRYREDIVFDTTIATQRGGLPFRFQSTWGLLLPISAIIVTVLGFNLLGDGLRRTLDPKLRQQEA